MSSPQDDEQRLLAAFAHARVVSEALAAETDTDLLLRSFAAACVDGSVELCAIDLHSPKKPPRRVACALGVALGAPSPALERPLAVSSLTAGEPRWVSEDADRDALVGKETSAALGALRLVSVGTVPLVIGGAVVGTVLVGSRRPGHFDDEAERTILVDLVARAAAALERAWLRLEARASNQLRDEFLSIVSHELRTPLSTILGWAKLLREGALTRERTTKAIEVIHRSALVQSQIIDELVDASRVLGGHLTLSLEHASVAAVVRETVAAFAESAAKKQLTITIETSEPSDARVDVTRLQQVVRHLMANAIKFSGSGGRIGVSVTGGDERVVLSVSDSGVGIEPTRLHDLFERFRPTHSGGQGSRGGMGLGLAMVGRIVEAHHGEVHAESPGANQGATFRVSFVRRPRSDA